ncbi:MAG: bifunctional hydroxymethylpyrimidine kinase/phosphomethylpyrimidine kinase [Dehalococcoidia bacterium]|nr:bifunctional hydroxymethylpyrimidine kinase/phosphomethylpyrimidine kinase [Dehalococcoidia bacterium]
MTKARIALTIAGSDSGGGAGIQADLKTFAALGVYGASAITAVTAQDTRRVYGFTELRPDFVAAQIDAVMGDMGADAVKIGMLASAPIIEAVAERLKHWGVTNLVIDPVMVAKGGDTLLREDAVDALKQRLMPLALVLTPNLPEAEALVGRSLTTWEDIKTAAEEMSSWGVANVVIKGGHSEGPTATDLLYDGHGFREFSAPRIDTQNTHGTGCTFASAIAATLAKNDTVPNAIAAAKAYVTLALQNSYAIGEGHSPVHHFYRYWRPHLNEG